MPMRAMGARKLQNGGLLNYFAAGGFGLYLILFLLMPLFCDTIADFLVMLDIYDLFKGSFSPPSSDIGRRSQVVLEGRPSVLLDYL